MTGMVGDGSPRKYTPSKTTKFVSYEMQKLRKNKGWRMGDSLCRFVHQDLTSNQRKVSEEQAGATTKSWGGPRGKGLTIYRGAAVKRKRY